jgi:hypothetical protein
MKGVEKAAIILIILMIATIIFSYFSNFFVVQLYGPEFFTPMNLQTKIASGIILIFRMLVHIGVAIWLFSLARKQQAQPWVWCLFGLCFGLIAAVLFYLIRLYNALVSKPPENI